MATNKQLQRILRQRNENRRRQAQKITHSFTQKVVKDKQLINSIVHFKNEAHRDATIEKIMSK